MIDNFIIIISCVIYITSEQTCAKFYDFMDASKNDALHDEQLYENYFPNDKNDENTRIQIQSVNNILKLKKPDASGKPTIQKYLKAKNNRLKSIEKYIGSESHNAYYAHMDTTAKSIDLFKEQKVTKESKLKSIFRKLKNTVKSENNVKSYSNSISGCLKNEGNDNDDSIEVEDPLACNNEKGIENKEHKPLSTKPDLIKQCCLKTIDDIGNNIVNKFKNSISLNPVRRKLMNKTITGNNNGLNKKLPKRSFHKIDAKLSRLARENSEYKQNQQVCDWTTIRHDIHTAHGYDVDEPVKIIHLDKTDRELMSSNEINNDEKNKKLKNAIQNTRNLRKSRINIIQTNLNSQNGKNPSAEVFRKKHNYLSDSIKNLGTRSVRSAVLNLEDIEEMYIPSDFQNSIYNPKPNMKSEFRPSDFLL